MNGNIFIDTNILVYTYSVTEPAKQAIARNIILAGQNYVSTQVLQELANTLNKKFKIDWVQINEVLAECSTNLNVYINTEYTISQACIIADRYKYSFYDSLIISAALQTNSNILYSEDMQHGHLIEGKLKICNPFV
ncbi:MAG: PIN domain-containing protein [Mucilaginibacter sp.]